MTTAVQTRKPASAERRVTRAPKADATLAAALDEARAAAESIAERGTVGAHVAMVMEAERLATHLFECTAGAYRGWRWAVTVARAARAKVATVDEVVLLPGPESLVAPAWVPWSERVAPGDLGVGDVLPTSDDDERLAPGWSALDDLAAAADDVPLRPDGWELGLGRRRVLSAYGRDDATHRWWTGETGPETPMARSAPAPCSTCGFLLPIGGPTGAAFGVCANGLAPADGRVVSLAYGCGAHSEAVAERARA